MLSLLHIENIAVIESADITFDRRLNLLTGETGAGKSIVIDALNALLGRRTSRELIRFGKDSTEVTGVFSDLPGSVRRFLEEAGFSCEEELMVSRVLQNDGRNLCRVDGKPVSLAVLRALGDLLINIHGQQDTGTLLQEERHLDFLDSFAGVDRAAYGEAYKEYKALCKEWDGLQMAETEKQSRIELLQSRMDELAALNPQEGETEQLMARRKTLRAAGRILELLENAYVALYGNEEKEGACELFETAADALSDAALVSDEFAGLSERLNEMRYTLSDSTEEIRDAKERMDDFEAELEQIEQRLDMLHKAERKYNMTLDALQKATGEWQSELDALCRSEDRLEELEKLCKKAGESMLSQGKKLREQRRVAAKALEERMVTELSELDMQKVRFSAKLAQGEPTPRGLDDCVFLLSANPGEPLKPLSKIASGGEMARIMLALKNILAEGEDVPTLVFDEVDSGVSGRAAQRVAQKLCAVSRHKQVLCVTHLPQIAAMADSHFFIQKGVRGDRTFTEVQKMSRAERVEELSRLVAGETITDATRKNAEELLLQAETYKNT